MLAQYILFFAPLQMISDMPSQYQQHPDILKFLAECPTVWDDTKVVCGKMGEYVVVARRSGGTWYIGGMCDWNGKKVEIDLSKIVPEGSYKAEIFFDPPNSDMMATDYKRAETMLKSSDKFEMTMRSGGGFAIKLVPDSSFLF